MPIGAILRQLETRLRIALPRNLPKPLTSRMMRHVTDVYREFDSTYQTRIDYKLWRRAGLPLPSEELKSLTSWRTEHSISWDHWSDIARVATESNDSIIFWSVVALASDLIKSARSPKGRIDPGEAGGIMDRLQERLRSKPERILWCPASCEMAAALFLMQFQFCHLPSKREDGWREKRNYHQFSIEEIEEWLRQVEAQLRRVDPKWKPGQRINTARLEKERKECPVLRGGFALEELAILTETLREVFPFISENEEVLDDRAKALRRTACDYAYTAWITARAWRLRETRYQEMNATSNPDRASRDRETHFKIRQRAFIKERDCILNLSNALRDAERYLESALFFYRFMRLTPNEFADDPYIVTTLYNRGVVFQQLREAGFEVDPRFAAVEKIAEQRELAGEQGRAKKNERGFFRVIERDQKELAAWAPVIKEFPQEIDNGERLKAYVRRVMRLLVGTHPASRQALEAGYQLALRYGYIRTAAKILERAVENDEFEFKNEHVLKLVERVVQCMSFDPFSLDYETLGEWHQLIRRACFKLYQNRTGANWLSGWDKINVHEALLGTTHTHHRSLGRESASRLFGKAVGTFSVRDLREFYDRQHDFLVSPPAPATSREIAAFCRRNKSSSLGQAAYVSILCMQNLVSVVGVGENGRVKAEDVPVKNLPQQLQEIVSQSKVWFRYQAGLQRRINWSADLIRIGRAVMSVARKCNKEARVIILAVEPHLAALPWQHLIAVSAATLEFERSADRAVTQYLVSIVPNARAIMLDASRDFNLGILPIISSEKDPAILEVSDSIARTTLPYATSRVSACVVVGHGKKSDGGDLPVINLGHKQLDTIEEWVKIMRARHVILHCCHSAGADALFMHELGGLPGIALSLGSSVLLAPVTEVGERTAITLQESVFENPESPIGKSYLNAVSKNPTVCLYNFFGNPYDKLVEHTSMRPVQ